MALGCEEGNMEGRGCSTCFFFGGSKVELTNFPALCLEVSLIPYL